MKEKAIVTIALSYCDYCSLQAKLRDAAQWVASTAAQEAELAVQPEELNLYRGERTFQRPAAQNKKSLFYDYGVVPIAIEIY